MDSPAIDPRVAATLSLAEAVEQEWDVLVIGAGPAGSVAAGEAARRGARTLLVDRATFPRRKVCGCCLNGAALGVLEELGLGQLPSGCGALPLRQFQLASQGQLAAMPLHVGVSLSRERLDAALLQAAVERGAAFLDGTRALAGGATRRLRCVWVRRTGAPTAEVMAKIVVVAGGLACRAMAHETRQERLVSESSRIGAGAVLEAVSSDCQAGTIYMACQRTGYVGLVRLEDQRLDVAAALDAVRVKQLGGMGPAVAEILATSGLEVPPGIATAKWQGTAKLTQQRRQRHGDRIFVVGDAAGYVEPFTGEGIAWALASGRAVAPLVLQSLVAGTVATGPAWTKLSGRLLGARIRRCRAVSGMLRYPTAVRLAVRVLRHAPCLARPVVRALNASFY